MSTPTVTLALEIVDNSNWAPKLIVPAVPTVAPLSFTITPEPEPTTPVNPEPSPTKVVAFTCPLILIFPVPVIFLLFKLKLPPNSGVKSSITFANEAPWPETIVLYEAKSTVSPANKPTPNMTDVPFTAVNSDAVNLTPFTNTSR